MTRKRSNGNVKITIGGSKVRVPSKVTAVAPPPKKPVPPKKHGRRYPEHANTHHPNDLPEDPWDVSKVHSRKQREDLITKWEKYRFYREELSEEYVDAKMAEYRAGGVPKLITYALPEEVDDAYASLMVHPINHPKLRPRPVVQHWTTWIETANSTALTSKAAKYGEVQDRFDKAFKDERENRKRI